MTMLDCMKNNKTGETIVAQQRTDRREILRLLCRPSWLLTARGVSVTQTVKITD